MLKRLNTFISIFFVLIFFGNSIAQKEIRLTINQLLGTGGFKKNKQVSNNLGNQFTITRLDYYISKIVLYHDAGKLTEVKDLYILVRNGELVDELLGTFNITKLDSMIFYIGVDSPNNHADPVLWPSNHPLAPKTPEMQWGWAGGYRFVAIEGKSGSNSQYSYEIHALSDVLYKPTTIVTKGFERNGKLLISLEADYIQGLSYINVDKSFVTHGSTGEAITLLANFNNKVFTPSINLLANKDIKIGTLQVAPNPSIHNIVKVTLNENQIVKSTLIIRDALGRLVSTIANLSLQNEVNLPNQGMYFIELIQEGNVTYSSSVIRL
jgi:hypothetical protein